MNLKAAIVGYGSIGSRHVSWLQELGCDVAVVSKRQVEYPKIFNSVKECLGQHRPDYVVIANATAEHADTLQQLSDIGFSGKVLVEKPLFKNTNVSILNQKMECYTAYNLRFHPLLQRMHKLLQGRKIAQAQVYVGKYLPDWRPGQKIRYSGSQDAGGGVLRDLSHELDYVGWLFGPWKTLAAVGGRFSSLDISSDDVFSILGVTQYAPAVTVQMNYLDRIGRRELIVQCDDFTLHGDLLQGHLTMNETIETFSVGKSDTYLAQHRAVLAGDKSFLCSYQEGLRTVQVIEAAEKAVCEKKWVAV